MTRFLDWLDEAAGGLIRVAYLVWGIVAVAAYFGDGTVPPAIAHTLAAVAPWVLAFSVETHTYLTARRVRAAWQGIQAAQDGTAERTRAAGAMKVNLWILGGLLAFSMFNQLQYLAATWTPPHTALALPGPLAYIIRAVIVPAAFMAAAFLAPMGESLPAQVQAEAHRFAAATFKVARRQWRTRLREMRKQGQDVTGALVQLVDDPAERRVIGTIYQAMYPAATVPALAAIEPATVEALPASAAPPDKPPTGPGSPSAAPVRTPAREGGAERPVMLRLEAPPEWRQGRRQTAQAAAPGGANRRRVRTPAKATVEAKARGVWQPGMTVTQLQRAAGISRASAGKFRRTFIAEIQERDQAAAQ